MAQIQYTPDDFAGMGVSAGEARRLSDRANELNSGRYERDDFGGLGFAPGVGARAADRLNNDYTYGKFPTYEPTPDFGSGSSYGRYDR